MAKAQQAEQRTGHVEVTIPPPNFQTACLLIEGTSPYVQNKFSQKARNTIKETQAAGSTARGKKKREPKDFDAVYKGALYCSTDGWYGMPAPAFRNAAVSACRLVNFKMTLAKLSIFVEADGFDADDGTPLIRITKGEPVYHETYVRNATGVVDLRARPMWREGWRAKLRVRYDRDQFTEADVANLVMRIGQQVGIGEGRPDSKNSCGMGWGLFQIVNE